MADNTTTTSNSTGGENVSRLDQMSDLLLGDDQGSNTDEETLDSFIDSDNDSEEADGSTDESTSNEQEESDENENSEESAVTWASALGVDDKNIVTDEDGNLAGFNVKVDGVISTVDLPTLIAGYQTTKDYTQKTQALAEDRRKLESVKTVVVEEYTKKLDAVEKLTKHLAGKFLGEFEGVDWQSLRVTNPGEYAAMVQDYNIRRQEFDRIFEAVEQERGVEQQKIQQTSTEAQKEFIKVQAQKLIENNPEWSDVKKMKTAFDGFQSFVQETYGFTPEEFATVHDARLIELVKDAQKYRQSIAIADKKQIKPAPKFQKTTTQQGKKVTKLDQLIKVASKAKGAQKRDAQVNAIAALIAGE